MAMAKHMRAMRTGGILVYLRLREKLGDAFPLRSSVYG